MRRRGPQKLSGKTSSQWWPRIGHLLLTTGVIAFFLAPMCIETWEDLRELVGWNTSCSLQEIEAPASFSRFQTYERIFRLRGHRPDTDAVVAMGIAPAIFPVQSDLCAGRTFMAYLLTTMIETKQASDRPRVIAIDRYYSPDACKDTPILKATESLKKAVEQISKDIPVVIGQSTRASGNDEEPCLCPSRGLEFPNSENLSFGYVRFNEDPLHIPVRWNTPQPPMLGFAMAAAATSPVLSRNISKWLRYVTDVKYCAPSTEHSSRDTDGHCERREEHPFGDLDEDAFSGQGKATIDAREYLCLAASEKTVQDIRNLLNNICQNIRPNTQGELAVRQREMQDRIRGRIVVIGSEDEKDQVSVLERNPYGYQIQAMYVAALLGHAYLREWPLLLRLLMSFFIFYSLERSFEIWGPRGTFPRTRSRLMELLPFRKSKRQEGHAGAFGFVCLCLLLPWILAAIGLRFDFMPPIPLLSLTLVLFVLKTSAYLTAWKEELDEERTKHNVAPEVCP